MAIIVELCGYTTLEMDLLERCLASEPDIDVLTCSPAADAGRGGAEAPWLRIRSGSGHAVRPIDWCNDDLAEVIEWIRVVGCCPGRVAPLEGPRQSRQRPLTEQEADVMRLVAAGRTASEIGEDLNLAPRVVEAAKRRAYRKLGVRRGIEAVTQATV